MSLSLVVAVVGALVAGAGTGVLGARCFRAPAVGLGAWTVALLGLFVAAAAQVLGHGGGFGPTTFRAMELGAQVVAPLALCLGLAEVAGRSIPARFAARLLLPAVALVSIVILGSDPLSSAVFSKAWPAATVYYQIIPNKLLEYLLAPVTAVIALVLIGVVAVRQRRDPAWREAMAPVAAAGVAALALALPGLASGGIGPKLSMSSLFAVLCVLAAALTWVSGVWLSRLRLGLLHEGAAGGDGWGPASSRDRDEAYYDRSGDGRSGRHGDDRSGDDRAPYQDSDIYEWGDDDVAAPSRGGQEDYDDRYADGRGDYGGGFRDAGPAPAGAPGGDGAEAGDLFGQIAIYTLLEDRMAEFDHLTRKVVKQVRSQEPDTLVYIVHEVPSAPLQRILYEVYRDHAAYEAHQRQPHVVRFEADRGPYVLATNVIELGLQQAKVSPLPSITDLLADTGYDLLGDTGHGQPGYGPSLRRASPVGRAAPASRPDPLDRAAPASWPDPLDRAAPAGRPDPLDRATPLDRLDPDARRPRRRP